MASSRNLPTGLKIGLVGFALSAVGASLGFIFYFFDFLIGAQLAFFIVVLGVSIGFVGIGVGWLQIDKSAVLGSYRASQNLRKKYSWKEFKKIIVSKLFRRQ
jgi:hypothetical protein